MRGLRLFSSFGFTLPKKDKEERTPARVVTDYEEWVHAAELQNWTNTEKWELLFEELPDPELEDQLNWGIDTKEE